MPRPSILRLALPSPLRRLFDYLPPRGLDPCRLQPGVRLRVPFGRREIVGVLVELADSSQVPEDKLRPALAVLDREPPMPAHLLELCRWTAQYYQHSLGDTLSWALPNLLRQGEPAEARVQRFWLAVPGARLDDPRLARAPRQRQALQTLQQHPHGVLHELLGQLDINKDSLDLLVEKGLATLESRRHVPAEHHGGWLAQAELPLNAEQRAACEAVRAGFGAFHSYLLAGVTGSGKTEVYLQLIHQVLEAGKQALVLIPEINLGPQTLSRFERRFNARIALLHSALTDRERLDAWLAARDGEADIVIGTRSALFTPLKNPGLIIIDEEHDASYKQQEGLRYHARDLALVRARLEKVPILLGSATPSLESLHNAASGRYGLLRLTQRAGGAQAPKFQRLDVKSLPLDAGLSMPLQRAIGETLGAGQQVLVYLNRRGFAPTLLCHDCGWISQCPRCDARMTLHQGSGELRCHHCDHRERPPRQCPKCGQLDLRPVGAGTERAEERLRILFPDYPVLRIDRDSTSRKHAMRDLFATINKGEPCILVGTQMLAKGHHFPRVTLVAILDADGGLFSADFRASERMAQQIVQVAGRAGRAEEPGRVLIQTHLADHPLLVQLTEQGYFAFADQALAERRTAGLPPFCHLALLRAEAHKPGQAEGFLEEACAEAERLQAQLGSDVELLGPVPAPMERRAGRFRAQLLLMSSARVPLHRLLSCWLPILESMPGGRQVRWSLDVDPIDLF
ncbi:MULTISPECIES: primosomal protein N' [unclassified Pseudomonas]|uniref:primosomal protein N' n=1 Tax=unclassified Pseudomonas TaxID=196821 RepID=UPI0002A37894|nr:MULTISPECIES: primosomal protein N' [unclassified Pseudomonas]NTX88694.1 primosomal protein N' [Pseudomonas sp. UMA643]NTY19364.1 primosomal protein N' [Pseudomonas sp. UMC3103]NTY24607.1 primosomal protein N' [Pseudomonas sp. UMA603]NTY31478.1 primosomal protein N' [Pseudomonas sp. UMC3129]NTY53733.1 primosomal protein N' [Pseudomonas sp. UMC631]NTY66655.1 primosomal protein N' [Pseudomonas sp. UMC3106]NUA34489.1 primosomal protein N' [Pseudomonas sp. UMA601]